MINGQKILAVVTARGGSKGVQRKNIHPLNGKPLIVWTIEEAKKSKYIDRLILSSDDHVIIQVAASNGCEVPFERPRELASDRSSSGDVILHAIKEVKGYDLVVLLQPTSPLRTTEDIDGCIRFCMQRNAVSCVSITKVESTPYWMYRIERDHRLVSLIQHDRQYHQRQLLPDVYELNGAIYIARTEWFQENKSFLSQETIGYEMPRERSLDIDTLMDFEYVELLMRRL